MSIEDPIIETFDMSSGFVKAAAVFLVGIMILGGFVFTAQTTEKLKTATITLTDLPRNGDIITLGNHVFEFDSGDGVQDDHIPVEIGDTLIQTKSNFVNAVKSSTDFSVD
jgi:hypothetical protein